VSAVFAHSSQGSARHWQSEDRADALALGDFPRGAPGKESEPKEAKRVSKAGSGLGNHLGTGNHFGLLRFGTSV